MMKSFFKKLSLVMALAMVVSMMAPAGAAFAAEAGIALQGTKTIVTEYDVEIGEEVVDFCFLGAPADWKTTFKWTTSNPEVATVDQTGLVTTLDDGVATITITAGADASYKHSVVLTVGEGEEVKEPIAEEVIADNKVRLTFADEKINAATLKNKLEFKYYVVEERPITMQLIKSITDVKDQPGVVDVELYTTMADGKTYSFVYGDLEAKYEFVLGTVTDVFFTIKDTEGYVVEVNDAGYTFVPVVYNNEGVDITTTAMKAAGAYVEYTLSEGDAYWAITDGVQFSEAGQALVTVTYYALNANNETVAMGNSWDGAVIAVAPTPWAIEFDSTPVYTIANSVNWDDLKVNKKLAVGDTKDLFVSVTDNKGKEVRTNTVDFEKGSFRFESTNDEILYVTDNGTLMPNKVGTVDVLVWFTANVENAVETLATVISVKVDAERGVRSVDASVAKNTLSTSALVEDANTTEVTVTVVDTLGDAEGVAGMSAKIEQTTTTPTGLTAPDYDTTATVGADGKFKINVTADANSAAAGSYATYTYKITVGSVTKTFSVTVRAPKTADAVTSYKVLVTGDTDLVVGDDKKVNQAFNVALIGLNNGVANKTLAFTGTKASATPSADTLGKFFYEVKKGADALTTGVTLEANGSVTVGITQVATNDSFKQTANATASAIQYVKDSNGSGTYAVTVWTVKYNETTKTYYWSKVSTTNQSVGDTEATVTSVEKVAPTFAIDAPKAATPEDVLAAVVKCFKFKVGNVELKAGADAYANYMLQVNENLVTNGNVCYVKSVTIYRNVDGVYVNCGTINVNSTIEFTQAE